VEQLAVVGDLAGGRLVEAGAGRLAGQLANPLRALAVRADRAARPELRLDISEGGFFVVELGLAENGRV